MKSVKEAIQSTTTLAQTIGPKPPGVRAIALSMHSNKHFVARYPLPVYAHVSTQIRHLESLIQGVPDCSSSQCVVEGTVRDREL